jgi:hypothetical protein
MTGFLGYCRQRLVDDPHLWSTTLFDEVVALGFGGSYQAFTASVRRHELRPRCACAANKHKDRSVIEHPAGQQVQWDWLERLQQVRSFRHARAFSYHDTITNPRSSVHPG